MNEEILDSFHKGYEEGIKCSSDTVRVNDLFKVEFEGYKKEWDSFKQGIITLIVGSFSVLIVIGIWVGTMQATVSTHDKHIEDISIKVEKINIDYARIDTKLSAIEIGIQELKQRQN